VKWLNLITLVLIVVGALNWGLVGLAEFDLVAWIFGGMEFGETNAASRIVYALVGLSGLYWLARIPGYLSSDRRENTYA